MRVASASVGKKSMKVERPAWRARGCGRLGVAGLVVDKNIQGGFGFATHKYAAKADMPHLANKIIQTATNQHVTPRLRRIDTYYTTNGHLFLSSRLLIFYYNKRHSPPPKMGSWLTFVMSSKGRNPRTQWTSIVRLIG